MEAKSETNERPVLVYTALKKVLASMKASDFCGCSEGDILEYYPDACEEVLEKFSKELAGMIVEEIKERP